MAGATCLRKLVTMMLKLDDRDWGEFKFTQIFSVIQRGKRLKTSDHITGSMPYISSSAINNGVDNFIGNDKSVRIFGNCITVANSGSVGKAFFHQYSFVASDHVTKLSGENMSKYIYLFMLPIISRLEEKYSFNREINDTRINKEVMVLPTTDENTPDWDFMEQYVKERYDLLKSKYRDKILLDIPKYIEIPSLEDKKWQEFKLNEVFSVLQTGKSKGLNHLKQVSNGISYLSATNRNNGVSTFVERTDTLIQKGNCIAFIRNGEGSMGYSVYKSESFIATSDITVGYCSELNKYTGLFITTIADQVRGKYSFNYKRSDTRLAKETLQLPINSNDQPDWDYMEQYTKNIMNKKLNDYLRKH